MLVDAGEVAAAKEYLSQDIEVVEAPLNDAWMRDIGPTFVHADDGSVAAVDWVFNGWGGQDWARWDRDAEIGKLVAELAGVPLVPSSLVNEGGGIQVDGRGNVLVTETVQLDPGRNPGRARPMSRPNWHVRSGPPR
jgi:agmatine deiminase